MNHALFCILEDAKDHLLIKDIGHRFGHLTITNDAENVVAILAAELGNRRLEYIDSYGNRDEILIEKNRFAGFAITNSKDRCRTQSSKP